jgi:hypothetical protein
MDENIDDTYGSDDEEEDDTLLAFTLEGAAYYTWPGRKPPNHHRFSPSCDRQDCICGNHCDELYF